MGALAGCDFHGDTFKLHTALDCLNTNLTAVIDSLAPLNEAEKESNAGSLSG